MERSKRGIPIALQIFLLSTIPVIVVTAVSSVIGSYSSKKAVGKTATELVQVATESVSSDLNVILIQYNERVKILADSIISITSLEALQDTVDNLTRDLHSVSALYYHSAASRFEEGGIFVDSSRWNPPEDWNPHERDWWKGAVANPDKVFVSEPYIDAMTNSLCITISQAALNQDGILLGVAAADLILDDLKQIVNQYKISDSGTCYLINSNGLYLVHQDPSKVMKGTISDDFAGIQQGDMTRSQATSLVSNGQYFGMAPVAGTSWFVVTAGNLSDFTNVINDTVWLIIVVMVVQLVIIIIAAYFYSQYIRKVFADMVKHCQLIAQGNFTSSFGSYVIREAESLSRGFETFSQNIRMLVGKIFKSVTSVSDTSTSLAQASDSIKESVRETVAAISQMDSSSSNQTIAVQQVGDAVTKIVGEAEKLSKEIDSQNQIISYSSTSIEEIVASIDSVHTRINAASSHVEELVQLASDNKNAVSLATQNIVNVRQESASLQEMNSVISSVAAQTNLLAMNAAIEAAHAGAAGKGFAVVADEIRKLAETAAKQSNSSSAYLKSIQSKIDGIAETALNIDKSFAVTIQRINDISQVVTQLEQATGEQEMLSEQVLRALGDIQDSTRNITSNVGEITSSTTQTSQLCNELIALNNDVNSGLGSCKTASVSMQQASDLINEVASSTKDSVSDLLEAVSSFQVDRRTGSADRRQKTSELPEERERRKLKDRRKNPVSLKPPTLS